MTFCTRCDTWVKDLAAHYEPNSSADGVHWKGECELRMQIQGTRAQERADVRD